jgi:MFS family permease
LLLGAVVGGVGLGALAFTTSLPVALVVSGVAVGALLVMDIVVTTLVQRDVPDAMRGRAMGLLQFCGVFAALAGSLVAPALVPLLGLGTVLVVIGAIQIVAAVAAVAILRHQGTLEAQADIGPVAL